jgi:hypothetical protein
MIRILWIIGLCIALFVFSAFVVFCSIALFKHRFLSLSAWLLLISFASGVRFIFGWLRSAIKYGDPTKNLDPNATV